MTRLIDIEDVSLLKKVTDGGLSAKALWRRINSQPTVDAESVRHGHWKNIMGRPLECSVCGIITNPINGIPWANRAFKYCPNCGARMDEVSG